MRENLQVPAGLHVSLPPHIAAEVTWLSDEFVDAINALPPHLIAVIANAPTWVDRRKGANLVEQHLHPVSHRSLEVWRLPWRRVNNRAITPTVVLLAVAYKKMTAAPIVMGGGKMKHLSRTVA